MFQSFYFIFARRSFFLLYVHMHVPHIATSKPPSGSAKNCFLYFTIFHEDEVQEWMDKV